MGKRVAHTRLDDDHVRAKGSDPGQILVEHQLRGLPECGEVLHAVRSERFSDQHRIAASSGAKAGRGAVSENDDTGNVGDGHMFLPIEIGLIDHTGIPSTSGITTSTASGPRKGSGSPGPPSSSTWR